MNAVAFATPVALLVGLPSVAADACTMRLARAGYRVSRAAHGPAACEQAQRLQPSVVVVSRNLWALERRAVDVAAAAVAARVIDDAMLDRFLAD